MVGPGARTALCKMCIRIHCRGVYVLKRTKTKNKNKKIKIERLRIEIGRVIFEMKNP
jgi:hypothetical protein